VIGARGEEDPRAPAYY